MRMRLGVVLLLVMNSTVADYSDAMKALSNKDYKAAYREFMPLAKSGNTDAQLALGRLYLSGWGVKADLNEALDWYTKAAKAGNEWAQLALGEFYHRGGGGFAEDYKTASKWFKLSAKQGNDWAQQHLARMYFYGQGVPKDLIRSHMWWNIVVNVHGLFSKEELKAISKKMSSDQIEQAHALARECVASDFEIC